MTTDVFTGGLQNGTMNAKKNLRGPIHPKLTAHRINEIDTLEESLSNEPMVA